MLTNYISFKSLQTQDSACENCFEIGYKKWYFNPLTVTPFLRMDIKMHYSNLNGCNSRMLLGIDLSLVLF